MATTNEKIAVVNFYNFCGYQKYSAFTALELRYMLNNAPILKYHKTVEKSDLAWWELSKSLWVASVRLSWWDKRNAIAFLPIHKNDKELRKLEQFSENLNDYLYYVTANSEVECLALLLLKRIELGIHKFQSHETEIS